MATWQIILYVLFGVWSYRGLTRNLPHVTTLAKIAYLLTTDAKVMHPAAKSGQETVSCHTCNDQSCIFNKQEH